ncbi:SIR2 family protein [Burkholderia multivorans]|uniref:SIR2 family protein n=1 Tax=Burkholderia multivorans TaxID=87883 RepID=UPI000A5CDB23|nr:SIR2 family protein [Burkholderia multivorans]
MDVTKLVAKLAQECINNAPIVVLGSGASAAHGIPGMMQLGEHLKNSNLPLDANEADRKSWRTFCEGLETLDLESALTQVILTEAMTRHVVRTTWDFLNPYDLKVFEQLIANRRLLPLTRLFQHLFRSTVTDVQVVTPNYDRIAEYAAEAGNFTPYTGFTFGTLASRSPKPPPRVIYGRAPARTVSVWKVHGSFGWFADADGVVTSLPPMQARPSGLEPIIVTPGVEKYRRTHDEPFRTTMAQADDAVRSASGFFCVGFGFNDQHLQSLLVERCHGSAVPLVLITRSISDKAHEFFKSGRCPRYLAMERVDTGTRVFCSEIPEGVALEGVGYWQLSDFMTLIM